MRLRLERTALLGAVIFFFPYGCADRLSLDQPAEATAPPNTSIGSPALNYQHLKELIDYNADKTKSPISHQLTLYAVIIAFLSLIITISNTQRQRRQDFKKYLSDLWSDVLGVYYDSPSYRNLAFTEAMHASPDIKERAKYDAFCQRAWSFAYLVADRGFETEPFFRVAVRQLCVFHSDWLERNPFAFKAPKFWSFIDELRKEPFVQFRHATLPRTGNDIDWATVSGDYYHWILSPLAPEMVESPLREKHHLLNYLHKLDNPGAIVPTDVVDLGCGPGNLLAHLPKCVRKITGVDLNPDILRFAEAKATNLGIELELIVSTIEGLPAKNCNFDLAISVNSILPDTRRAVAEILTAIRKCLKPGGKFVAILPSFDTTLHLRSLWKAEYERHYPVEFTERCMKAFDLVKKVNRPNASFADDGVTSQCYHTLLTIPLEFEKAGLRIIEGPTKLYYPWSLTGRFDYGNFPNASERIWDWFVVAEPK